MTADWNYQELSSLKDFIYFRKGRAQDGQREKEGILSRFHTYLGDGANSGAPSPKPEIMT